MSPSGRAGLWGALILLGIATVGLGVSGYKWVRNSFPEVSQLKTHYPWLEPRAEGGRPLVRLKRSPPPGWVPIDQVSSFAIGAVVVSEDWNFFHHDGYDPAEIKEALKKDLFEGRFARGASTITQQVVKNVFLEHDKTLWRKFREFVLSIELDEKVSKRRILEVYFNIVEWGDGIYGIRQASHRYFGKHPSELGPKEAAFLAMLLPSPKRYSQSFRDRNLTPYARRTVRSILRKMVKGRYLDSGELEEAWAFRLAFEPPPEPKSDEESTTSGGTDFDPDLGSTEVGEELDEGGAPILDPAPSDPGE